ncbi:MAG: threonylcarbamoyl-AMP synthase [Planctomycetes bacterium]|nr:threonylcarbamoyl-AMP synthase [Planctomycetota bacterium]
MQTEVLIVDPQSPETIPIARAAEVLRRGGLVAFPTETVYGLGANALDAAAVRRIFEAKGRPANNPIIVHVAEVEQARQLVAVWPLVGERLAVRFWPGPLTLVLPRRDMVPDIVTAGGPTVAVRMPAHPVSLALIRAAGLPIAAPSANRSTQLSPTRAEHVLHAMQGRIDLLLDGGPTSGGLESTVLDLTSAPPRLLRLGLITRSEIEAIIGPIVVSSAPPTGEASLPSPGMLPRHYAPRTPLECAADGSARVKELREAGLRVGRLALSDGGEIELPGVTTVRMPAEPSAYAAQFYATLHVLDAAGLDRIVVDLPPDHEEWLAIRDRLRRASTPP